MRRLISLELWSPCKFAAENKSLMKAWHKVLLESVIKMTKAMKLLFQMMMTCMQLMIGLLMLVKETLNWTLLLMLNLQPKNILMNSLKWSLKEKSWRVNRFKKKKWVKMRELLQILIQMTFSLKLPKFLRLMFWRRRQNNRRKWIKNKRKLKNQKRRK